MAVRIRLKRTGTKNVPAYRVVVADSRSPRDGKFIEEVGYYNPLLKENNFVVKMDRVKHWISKGAKPTETVASLVRKAEKQASAAAAQT